MPLIFWTKMNDIRSPSGYFLRLDACEKPFTQARQTHTFVTTPFSPLYLVAQNVVVRRCDGACPKTKHVHWGSLAIAGACHFVSVPSLSSLDAHQDKNKSLPPSFFGWSNRFLPQNKFVTFSDFASFYLSVCTMLKTHSEARKTVLNFQRRFGCFIG
ncbi:hypothetical protein J4727_20235 [Providencia rettgeri]|uniref:Uncharacterized protein n=1 Tax=Providencia rettgeri TaxID=587 RepID=A0A939SPP2_PRORE|nr:hypothetical protein [Providencia rettgeri]